MAKVDFDILFAAATQTAEGTYNAALDAITTSISGDSSGTDEGLLLGRTGTGIGDSGLSLTMARGFEDKAVIAGSFTRGLSDFAMREVSSLSFTFPFCGNLATLDGTPDDAEFIPLMGVRAILAGAGMVSAVWDSGVGYQATFGSTAMPFSSLIYFSGNRIELLDCRCSTFSVAFEPGSIPVATATIDVNEVKDVTPAAFPTTVDYGNQATKSVPVVKAVANNWQATRGFSSLTLNISNDIAQVGDSNAANASAKEIAGRETTVDATIYATDSDPDYEIDQLAVTDISDLDELSFQVGTPGVAAAVADAVKVQVFDPEVQSSAVEKLGSKFGNAVKLVARSATADGELTIAFN